MAGPAHDPSRQLGILALLASYPLTAAAHDGDMSIYLFGPLSFVFSLVAMRVVSMHWALKALLMLSLWPLLVGAAFGVAQSRFSANYESPPPSRDDSFITVAFLYLVAIPVVVVVFAILLRSFQRWLNSGE